MKKMLRLNHHEFADFYSELCDVICRHDLGLEEGDGLRHTSAYARKVALLIVERLANEDYLQYV